MNEYKKNILLRFLTEKNVFFFFQNHGPFFLDNDLLNDKSKSENENGNRTNQTSDVNENK